MAIRLYLDEDVDPLLAQVLRERHVDCLSTREADMLGSTDEEQLVFATEQGRAILTFNVRDFVRLANELMSSGKPHGGIIVSDHLPFRELLRRVLRLAARHSQGDLANSVHWLQDYKAADKG